MCNKHKIIADTEAPLFNPVDADTREGKEGLEVLNRELQLDVLTWLPFCAKTYHISPDIEDYIIIPTPLCPADLPNRNGIAFPLSELTMFQPPPMNRMVYKAWTGCPLHLEHDNEDHTKALGAVLDTSLHRVNGYGGGKIWKVMSLVAVSKTKRPDIAQRVLANDLTTFSMGSLADYFTCSYCGQQITENHNCEHINVRSNIDFREFTDFDGSKHLAFRNAHGLSPIEFSIVADPAWTTAKSDIRLKV